MSMRRRNPFEEFEQFLERMSRGLEESDWSMVGGGSVSIDVAENGDEFVVVADLPGYERDDIELTLSNGTLRINAEREESVEEADEAEAHRYIRRERRQQSISRSVRLPEDVKEEEAVATYKNGVLTVTLPKLEAESGGRRIDID